MKKYIASALLMVLLATPHLSLLQAQTTTASDCNVVTTNLSMNTDDTFDSIVSWLQPFFRFTDFLAAAASFRFER